MKNLTETAQKLHSLLKNKGGMFEQDILDSLFGKIEFSEEKIREHYQWCANLTGQPVRMSMTETLIPTANYSNELWNATKELKCAGLVVVKNKGYNNYFYQPK